MWFRYHMVIKSKIKCLSCKRLAIISLGVLVIILSINSYYISKFLEKHLASTKKTVKIFPFEGEKFVHLDLKGAPPKISYLLEFLDLVKKLGATGIVIEYEDMFPYSGRLKNISAGNAYTLQDIEAIDSRAKSLNLQVVPLVQTFGHLGFLLKNEEFKHLREYSSNMEVICPSNEESKSVLIEMISQVLKRHPRSKIIHIGGDEVLTLGRCPKCSWRLRGRIPPQSLFLEHITSIAFKIKQTNPKLKILMWDDHLRKMDPNEIKLSNITNYVEPVVWYYGKDVPRHIEPKVFSYNKNFKDVWIASAFKGASKSNQYAPDVQTYLANHKSWMQTVQYFKGEIKFSGIILTGWQRYDHFSVLCELLPIAIPTLAICMHYIQGIQVVPHPTMKTAKVIGCNQIYGLMYPNLAIPKCTYPGSKLMEPIINLHAFDNRVSDLLENDRVKIFLSNNYNLKFKYYNPFFLEKPMLTLREYSRTIYTIKLEIIKTMMPIYDRHTIIEWIETYVDPLLDKIQLVLNVGNDILNEDTKPRRPLTLNTT